MEFQGLPRVQDVEKESQYGYVYGVSGPGELSEASSALSQIVYYRTRTTRLYLALHVNEGKNYGAHY